ncbi:DUF4421 family protein [Namhaeicola litoreus]|uniref:DUF4421 family protein n=1 Tax=Namhaeicola litoreus TaxID=1052145 RepID=A0ABW3Y4R4_9FLAO
MKRTKWWSKSKSLILLQLLFSCFLFAQNNEKDSLIQSEYIENYHHQLNVRLEMQNQNEKLKISYEDSFAKIVPNLTYRYGIGLNYRFGSVRIGFRPSVSENSAAKKGESDVFTLKFKFLYNNWAHYIDYFYFKGFYAENSQNIDLARAVNGKYIQFPDLKSSFLTGESLYKFNPNFSLRAIETQTEIQIKSAGTFMAGIDYTFYSYTGAHTLIDREGNEIKRDAYKDNSGFYTGFIGGYYYTYVYQKYWYASGFVQPGAGIDFYRLNEFDSGIKEQQKGTDLIVNLKMGITAGYSGPKYYGGVNLSSNGARTANRDDLTIRNNYTSVMLFIGYRFKPPKTVVKSMDEIERYIPILQEDKN